MKKNTGSFAGFVRIVLVVFVSAFAVCSFVLAGSLAPSASPVATSYTLDDIYNRLITNATATTGNHIFSPSASPIGTLHTLAEIYGAIPAIEASKVLFGKTYLGIAGSVYGDTDPTKVLTVADGGGTAKGTYNATNLTAGNIKLDVAFGASGELGTLVPDGTAVAGDCLDTKTFYSGNSWTQKIGGLVNCSLEGSQTCYATGSYYAGTSKTASNSTTSQIAGYYPAFNLATVDTDLIAGNINKNANLFGVAGSYSGYAGSGSTRSLPSDSTTCQNNSGWYWLEDGNGDGDATDPADGVCVQATAITAANNLSWNGAEQVVPSPLVATAITEGNATTATKTGAFGTTNYVNHLARVLTGTGDAIDCWGRIKINTADVVTVYGSWLKPDYTTCATNPGNNNTITIIDDDRYDNTWIGDWSCVPGAGALNGTVSYGSYPTPAQVASGKFIALATADCYDGVRDLLPTIDESVNDSRIVYTATATAGGAATLTDTNASANWSANTWIGQKVKIFSGTSAGSSGTIELNTTTALTVSSWSAGNPDNTSVYGIIYIIPHSGYRTPCFGANVTTENNGPLKAEDLNNWKGTRLPSSSDFYGFCGSGGTAVSGDYKTSCSAIKTIGSYGGQNGRATECLSVSGVGYEWLSEQYVYVSARLAGGTACSSIDGDSVVSGYRFRAVSRP